MKKYNIKGGGTITAASNSEAVEMLRLDSKFGKGKNTVQYMHDFAFRYEMQNGDIIRCQNHDDFIHDLLRAGFLTEA